MNQAFLTFNAGEVSPYLRHRIDFEKTPAAAEELQNFIALPYGAAIKRPGLRYLATTEDGGLNSRALPFVASDGTRYILHFTAGTLTIYSTAGTVKDTLDFLPDYTWPTPFDFATSIRALQMVQLNDVAFLTHPACHPLRLSRLADTDWSLEWLPFATPPVLDENIDPTGLFSVVGNPKAAAWADETSYTAGDYARTGAEWLCLANHVAGAANQPGVGANWKSYWSRRFFQPGDPVTLIAESAPAAVAWSYNYHTYHAGEQASYAICTQDHSGVTQTPGLPPDNIPWAKVDEWRDWFDAGGQGTFPLGGYVRVETGSTIYTCVQAHDPSAVGANSEPGEGIDWEDYWELYGTFTDPQPQWFKSDPIPVGTVRWHNGSQFRCITEHRPGEDAELTEDAEPGVGDTWQDYWELIPEFSTSTEASARGPGRYFTISPEREAPDWQIECAAAGTSYSQTIAVQGPWNVFTYGTWDGTFYLYRSTDGGNTWTVARQWESSADRNIADSGEEPLPALLYLKYIAQTEPQSLTPARAVLIPDLPYITGHLLLDEYVSATEMRGNALSPCVSGMTWRWARGAMDDDRGYPRAIALHDSRLWLAATDANPVSLWASQTDDFINFAIGTNATDAIFASLAASTASPIRWLASQRRLWIGTRETEWMIGSDTSDQTTTPLNFTARPYSGFGSLPAQPLAAADALLFAERSGARLRELSYDPVQQLFLSNDLSRLAEHLTSPGILCFAWQQTREPGLWLVRRDGVLLHLSFSRQERVAAWSRHVTAGGLFRDVVVFPADSGDDQVCFIVDRGSASCLESFPTGWQAAAEAQAGYFHLDGLSGSATTAALPAHLLNTPVTAIIAGVETTATYTASPVTIGASAKAYQIGLPIASRLVSLPIDTAAQDGTTLARKKRTSRLTLSVLHSIGGQVWNLAESRAQNIPNLTAATAPVSGWFEVIPDAGHMEDLQLRLTHSAPHPFILRAATMRWNLTE